MSTPRIRPVMVRLSQEEEAEVLRQAAELQLTENRTVSKAEVLRRRAWGSLPIPDQSAA